MSRKQEKLLDQLSVLARQYGVDLCTAMRTCPTRPGADAMYLEDLVGHIVHTGRLARDPYYQEAVREVEAMLT